MAAKPKFEFKVEKARFDKFIRTYTKNMSDKTQDAMIRKIAFDLLEIIIAETPVDTGRARAGWTAYADTVGVGYDISGPNVTTAAISEGKKESSFSVSKSSKGTHIAIINAVNYIVFLEYGHSPISPHGMVRFAFRVIEAESMKKAEKDALKEAFAAANKEARKVKAA